MLLWCISKYFEKIVSFFFISEFVLVSPTNNYSRSILKRCHHYIIDLKKEDIKHTSEWTWNGLEICVLKKLLSPEEFSFSIIFEHNSWKKPTTTTNKKKGPVSIASGVNYECNALCIRVSRWKYHPKIIISIRNHFWTT